MSLSLPTHCHFDIIEYVKICIGLQLDGITSHASVCNGIQIWLAAKALEKNKNKNKIKL